MAIVLPDKPVTKTTSARRPAPFSTFATRAAYLTEKHREQTALAMPKPVAMREGGTHQTLVSTKWVSRLW
ncbi:hypothetical protein [Rhizobium sp. AB2/73]|uniref:hypothetical protein n=1 Tax=Rhizobium sp. AB2/73 TaxID=2795216 RepID=UPI000DDE44E2|nr:hypothetical protein [Rhizobium sp. AB2/73]QYA16469.1 hypothetical protein J5284_26465 [Rhizobium sp. AB2/73]UEQ85012.1 hypothetical protein I8E17_27795 [Rhizobium sp. AB2/73]